MKIKKNGKVIRLTESDLKKIVNRVLKEQNDNKFDMIYQPEIYRRNRENQIKKAEGGWMAVKKGVEKMLDAITIIDKKDSQSYKMMQQFRKDFKMELNKKGDEIIQQMKKEDEL